MLREFYGAFSLFAEFLKAVGFHVSHFGMPLCIVNDIRNFVFGLAGATVYGSCKSRKQKFVMAFTIVYYGCYIEYYVWI